MGKELLVSNSHEDERRPLLGHLMNHSLIKQQLTDHQIHWSAKPSFAKELDIAFTRSHDKEKYLAGVDIFSLRNCIGIKLTDHQSVVSTEKSLQQDDQLHSLFEANAEVAVLTTDDITDWLKFYEEVDRRGLLGELGSKALDLSGLERTPLKYHERIMAGTHDLLEENANYLTEHHVEAMGELTEVVDPEGALDIAFLREDKRTVVGVPLFHVRTAQLEEELLEETVLSDSIVTPGLIVRRPGENKREAYDRATSVTDYYQHHWPTDEKIQIPVVSGGQLSLWRKLGMTDLVKSHFEDSGVEAEDIIRFLFLGENSIQPGELALQGMSLPARTSHMLQGEMDSLPIDIIFFRKTDGQRRLATVKQAMWGIDLNAYAKGIWKLKPVGNVGGIVLMPKDWDREQMHTYAEPLRQIYNHHHGDPSANLLYVTKTLLDAWQDKGSALVPEEQLEHYEKVNPQVLRKDVEYGIGPVGNTELYYFRNQKEAAIGGAKDGIVEVKPNVGSVFYFSNVGAEFDVEHPAYREMTAKPSTALGIRPYLENGKLPLTPGVYSKEYIAASVRGYPKLAYDDNPNDYVTSFLRSELIHRFTQTEINDLLGESYAKNILKIGANDEKLWYSKGDVVLGALLPNHPHADHIGDLPFYDENAPVYIRTEAHAFLKALTAHGQTWKDKYTYVSRLTAAKNGSAYQRNSRNINLIHWNDQTTRLSPQLLYQAVLSGHSILGATMQRFSSLQNHSFRSVINTGDLRIDDLGLTEEAVNILAGKGDVIILETTNGPHTSKVSAGVSEREVARSLEETIKSHPKDLIIIAAPKNHPQRLSSIHEVARAAGRRVAVDYKHASVLNELLFTRMEAPITAEGFNFHIPKFGEDITLWEKPMTHPEPYQRALSKLASESSLGVVNDQRLSEEGDQWVVVVNPGDSLRNIASGIHIKNNLVYIYSSYFPYQARDKISVGSNYLWVRDNKGYYYADFTVEGSGWGSRVSPRSPHPNLIFHSSGHAPFSQMVDKVLFPLLDGSYKGKTIILVHGSDPVIYKRSLQEQMRVLEDSKQYLQETIGLDNPDDLHIITNLPRYNPKQPLSNKANHPTGLSGFYHRLD